ncbi:retrovirus-related pol polyprotein from transposon TNT 1-94 [Tanacetum coccineum]
MIALYNILKPKPGDVNEAIAIKRKQCSLLQTFSIVPEKQKTFCQRLQESKGQRLQLLQDKMLLAKKDSDEQVLLAEDQAWMESSSDSDQEINANMVFMAKMENVLSDSEESSSSAEETIAEMSQFVFDHRIRDVSKQMTENPSESSLQVQRVRTDNGTEFKNKTLAKFFDEVGISQQFSAAKRHRKMVSWKGGIEPYWKASRKGILEVCWIIQRNCCNSRIYNKRTRKIYESVNVNFDEISEMASKQFSLEPGLSNLNETGKSSNLTASQVLEISKIDLEDLFHNFYDEYFDSSKITKFLITNVETSNNEISSHEGEVFHEVSESFQEESSSSLLNDDVQQSSEEVMVSPTNTQSISNNMVPNVNEASSSHNVFNERLEDAYFDANTVEPANVAEALKDADWVCAMQQELDQFARLKIWRLACPAVGYCQQEGIDYDETFAPVARIKAICYILAICCVIRNFTVFQMDVKRLSLMES